MTTQTPFTYFLLSASNPGLSEADAAIGRLWLNTSSNDFFICKNSTLGAQVWEKYATVIVSVEHGGTGDSTLTNHGVLLGAGTSPINAVSVGATGTVLIGNTAADPTFSATPTLTSVTFGAGNALSTYTEQTSWTPVIVGGTVAGTGTYTTQAGYYTKIGNMIFASCSLTWTAHTGTGDMLLQGFP